MVRKKAAKAYIILLVLYALLFIAGLVNMSMGTSIFHTGLPPSVENGVVMGLSLLSLIKAVYELFHL